jgi:ketosteroid isomerase-like protein
MTDYKEVYLASTKAYQERDIDKMMEYVTDEFSWFNIVPDGAMKVASSKQEAQQGMKMLFENLDYISGHVDFAKQFGNLLVTVETDRIRQEGKEVRMHRLSMYECQDGKLHRCWSFPIKDDENNDEKDEGDK